MSDIKVLILAGEHESTTLIFNGIKDSFSIGKVIIEKPVLKKDFLKKRINKLGLLKVTGQILFKAYNIFLKKISQKRINEIKEGKNLNDNKIDEKIISKVDSVNSDKTIELIKAYQPDVVVVNGTRIIKEEVIAVIDVPIINTHVGITPKYRGVNGCYWALTENDSENCGVTIHLVDSGIDTGGILYQEIVEITHKDNFNTYAYLQIAVAIPLMIKSIHDISNKTYKLKSTGLPSKLWSHPTLMEYIKHRIYQGVK